MGEYEIDHFFDKGQASDSGEENFLDELRSLLISYNTAETNLKCLKLMQLLDLGNIEKGLIIFYKKYDKISQQQLRAQKQKID